MIRPYWFRHPIQLRFACVIALVLIPFAWVGLALWHTRDDLCSAMTDCFMCLVYGPNK